MWLITAGPTREYLDSVRFLSNGSSGTMGYALAREAADRGHEVRLVSGPVALPCPPGVDRVQVGSACEMLDAGRAILEKRSCDVLLGVAAVSDMRPRHRARGKPAKENLPHQIDLVPNPDVLATLAAMAGSPLSVGFALESMEDRGQRPGSGFRAALERARSKISGKGLDAIILNALASMEQAEAECWWVELDAEPLALGRGEKSALATLIVDRIEKRLRS